MPEPIEVRFSDCRCPGAPHPDGDVAYLRPFLDYAGGAEALRAMRQAAGDIERFPELVAPVYIRRGLMGWNRVDESGASIPIPADPATDLPWEETYWIADRADDLYGGSVLAPLVKQIEESSPNGRMASSPSTSRPSSPKRRKPSGRSSPSPSAGSSSSTG